MSFDASGYHQPYGEFHTTLKEIMDGKREFEIREVGSSKSLNCYFKLDTFNYRETKSFYDFLHSDWEINLTCAVDFTLSNGEAQSQDSLHYINPNGSMNQYEQAILTVGQVLENYDTDNLIPAFGFGGIPLYSGSRSVSHCFHLNGNENPQCQGLPGLMEAYKFSLQNVQLYGPTYFAPCLKIFIDYVEQNVSQKLYHIFLILTDGIIHDMTETKELIAKASNLPISIIIIGVGDEDFSDMEELDGDDESQRVLDKNDPYAKPYRDIVQFVKFQDFKHQGKYALSEEVLREVPTQVLGYLDLLS
eukprot:CAMPEP_0197010392 /NCGR_PEP_ID=MMETSP1380-20130617/54098_1 /TAXON_ID=5936 /ORGANISM="Euplotes crassus, Strain CT5" /LENGTH=303 /DNA_ID=CAMNT_0042432281 /DNA_START=664 /DNA_END=1575 /DNA_ORIENTATION=+